MLDFSWSHILILLVVALVVVGPKDLPRLMRMVGQWTGKARAMANEFRKSFDDIARQSELDELRAEIENLRHDRPLADVERDLNRSIVPDEMKSAKGPRSAAMAAAAAAPTVSRAEPIEIETAPAHEPAEPEGTAFEAAIPDPVDATGYVPPQP